MFYFDMLLETVNTASMKGRALNAFPDVVVLQNWAIISVSESYYCKERKKEREVTSPEHRTICLRERERVSTYKAKEFRSPYSLGFVLFPSSHFSTNSHTSGIKPARTAAT
jgi:hypothetical protein